MTQKSPVDFTLTQRLQCDASEYLRQTDWVVAKVGEAKILGHDVSALISQYQDVFNKRASARNIINH